MALICETVQAANMRELRLRRDESTADLVELRLDGVADVDAAGALRDRRSRVILTCRAAWEGGRFDGSEEERLRILADAISSDAEYVDVEWRADRSWLPEADRNRLVLSNHDFDGLPVDLESRLGAMRVAAGPGVVKVAARARKPGELLRLAAASAEDCGPHIVIGLGTEGALTRICPEIFGSMWTYGGEAAPGQIPVNELAYLYRVRSHSASTRRFALTGKPLAVGSPGTELEFAL